MHEVSYGPHLFASESTEVYLILREPKNAAKAYVLTLLQKNQTQSKYILKSYL